MYTINNPVNVHTIFDKQVKAAVKTLARKSKEDQCKLINTFVAEGLSKRGVTVYAKAKVTKKVTKRKITKRK